MRILVAADPRAGTSDHELYAALLDLGVDVQIVMSGMANQAPARPAGGGVANPDALAGRVHVSGTSRPGPARGRVARMGPRRWLRQLAPEVVLVDQECTPVAATRWVSEARRADVPVAVGAWADDEAATWSGRQVRRHLLRRTNGVFAHTPTAARRAREAGVRGPIGLVPPAACERRGPHIPPPGRSFTVGSVGPLSEDDGVRDLLAAINRLPREMRLILAGDGPLRTAAEANEKVDLRAGVARDEMAALYAEMDVLVVPSRRASTPREVLRPVLQAMAAGTPVIGAATGDIPWIISEVGGGMTFPPGDVATLAGLLMDVRTDPERWRAAGLRAKSEVSSRFSPGASAAALLDLAERLLAAQ